MKCLLKYQWVKLPRHLVPQGKGIMGQWAKLASRVAFRNGKAKYCGHINEVTIGTWAGGIVGLKSILGQKSRTQTLDMMDKLSSLGYTSFTLNPETKKLTYKINDWVVKCSGADCDTGSVYATEGYGFLCFPRNITQRLVDRKYKFEDADAWLDLWCHSVYQDPRNAFSYMAPVVQFGQHGAALTLENLGRRWGWEKTKVWRFLQKNGDAFTLHKLPGSFGCLIFNNLYPTGTEFTVPTSEEIARILNEIRIMGENTHKSDTDNQHINRLIALYSKNLYSQSETDQAWDADGRVADSAPIIRAYLSQCWNCKNSINDCWMKYIQTYHSANSKAIRGPCEDLSPRYANRGGSP